MRLIINAIVSVVILGTCFAVFTALGERTEPERKKPPRPKGILVETVPIKEHSGPAILEANGAVVPFREIQVAAEVSGRVDHRAENLRAGRTVKAGDVLIKIDPSDYRLEVQRLQHQVKQDTASLASFDVQIKNTKSLIELADQQVSLEQAGLKRLESLMQRDAGSQSDVDAARRALLSAQNAQALLENRISELQASRSVAEESLKLTQVQLERARLDEHRTEIRSPIDGVVVETTVEEDGYVQPGMTLAVIEDASAMEVNCNLTLDEMYWIWNDTTGGQEDSKELKSLDRHALPPTPVSVRFDLAERTYEWSGVLSRKAGAGLDVRTRTLPCRVLVDEPQQVRLLGGASEDYSANDGPRTLMRGMFVTVHIECDPHRELLKIPDKGIRPGQCVWIAKDNKLRVRPIEVVSREGDSVIVDSLFGEVHPDDQLIISPVANARDGLAVRTGSPDGPPGKRKQRKGSAPSKAAIN